MSTAFAKAFQAKAKAAFGKARKAKHQAGKSFGPADVPDGSYSAVISTSVDVGKKGTFEGVPIVRVAATINSGTHQGKEPSKSFFCEGKPIPPEGSDEMPTAEQQLLGLVGFLLPDYDVSEMEIDQLEDALALINERKIVCIIGVKNTENAVSKKKYQNVYFNKLVSFDGGDAPQEPEAADNDAPFDDNPEPEFAPAKGDTCSVEGKDGDWVVDSVSQSRQLANLTNDEGTKIRNIPWSDITVL